MPTRTNALQAQQTEKNRILVFPGTRTVFALGANSAPFAFSQAKVFTAATEVMLIQLVKLLSLIYLSTVWTLKIPIT